MHQSTTPSLAQTIWPRWVSRQFLGLPIVETLLPVTFGYSLSSEVVFMRQLRRWKRLWRRSLTRSQKRTSIGFSEVFGRVQQVHCSRKRLLWRGLEFHVCTINKSTHKKKVWKLILWSSYIIKKTETSIFRHFRHQNHDLIFFIETLFVADFFV